MEKSQNVAQSQLNCAPSHNGETVTFRHSGPVLLVERCKRDNWLGRVSSHMWFAIHWPGHGQLTKWWGQSRDMFGPVALQAPNCRVLKCAECRIGWSVCRVQSKVVSVQAGARARTLAS